MSEFSLLTEPWIPIVDQNSQTKDVSLIDVFLHAHEYRRLAGDMLTQDVAILRLLLAILYRVFVWTDANGNPDVIRSVNDAVNRWKQLWDRGVIPKQPLLDYFDKWKDHFYLYDEKYPFYQIPKLPKDQCGIDDKGKPIKFITTIDATKFDVSIGQSGERKRCLSGKDTSKNYRLTDAEAARWLVCMQSYYDASIKTKKSKSGVHFDEITDQMNANGVVWGRPLIYTSGRTLFETLLYNWVLFPDIGSNPDLYQWEDVSTMSLHDAPDSPPWEWMDVRSKPMVELTLDSICNPMQVYTLQTYRLHLHRDQNGVASVSAYVGDYFTTDMRNLITVDPMRFSFTNGETYQFWKEFGLLFLMDEDKSVPDVVKWIQNCVSRFNRKTPVVRFQYVYMKDVDKACGFSPVYSSQISFATELLQKAARPIVYQIMSLFQDCKDMSEILGEYAQGICRSIYPAAPTTVSDSWKRQIQMDFWEKMDAVLSSWLLSVSVDKQGQAQMTIAELRQLTYEYVRDLVKQLLPSVSVRGYNSGRTYSVPKVYAICRRKLKKYDRGRVDGN